MGTWSFPGVKRPGSGADHPPHVASRLKKEYSYTSSPPLGLRCLFWGELHFHLYLYLFNCSSVWRGGHALSHLVEALPYKSEGRGVDSLLCHWNFSLTYSFRPHYGPGVDSASNRNEYQEYFLGGKYGRCVGPSYADCLEIWEPQPPGTLWNCLGL